MSEKMKNDFRITREEEKHYFFLNPYRDNSFTRCPKCDNKTKIKKLPLTILLEKKKVILNINKTCKFCPYCDLIIAKKHELDSIIMQFLSLNHATKDDYFVIGTQDKGVYREGLNKGLIKENPLEGVSVFKNAWNFEILPSYWGFKEK